jgi:hypothetical protein
MEIRHVTEVDIPKWEHLSSEYDRYVKELVSDLTEWYEGNDNSPSYKSYMLSKINKKEAFMAVDNSDNCLGIIAFSYKNNNITFFGISYEAELKIVGTELLYYAINLLDKTKSIHINEIASTTEWIKQHKELFINIGFTQKENSLENGVPVITFEKHLKIN